MRKINTVFIGVAFIAALLTITACKALFSDIEEDFSYWASEPIITGFRAASAVQPSDEGFQCVPSASDVELTLTVRNPKKFSFIMPDSSGAPTDIVTFGSDVHDSSKTNPPLLGTDYTLEQSALDTLKLTYKAAFLKRYEWSSANIGAAIKLYSTDGRKFNQTYKFNLEANTPPPNPAPVEVSDDSHIALFKTAADDSLGKRYYVLCFKVDDMPGENVISGVPLYGDIKSVCVSKNGGAEISYPITLNSGYTDFDISNPSNIAFIAKDDVAPLSSTEAAAFLSSLQPDNVPSASWTLYLKTDIEVGGATAKYGIRLFDGKLYSALSEQTIGKRALPTPKVFAHPDIDNVAVFGVYTEGSSIVSSGTAATVNSNDLNGSGANNGSTATNAIPVYSAYGETVKLAIKKSDGTDYPAGVTVTGSAEFVSGASISGTASFTAGQSAVVTLPSPTEAGGEAVYKVTIQATGEGFDDSATRTLYYKVRRELKTVNNLPVWYMLGAAIEKIPLGRAGTVKISGILKAENIGGYPPHPDGSSVVNNSTIDVSGKKDSGDYPGRTVTVIGDSKTSSILDASNLCSVFNIEFNGKLILKNVTLQNAKNNGGGYGGGIYISDNGSSCEMTDTDIKNCTVTAGARLGGAVYVREDGSLTVGSGCVISNNTASGGNGDGIYVQSGGTFNISGDAKIDEANDVFLEKNADVPYDPSKNAKITVTAPLTGTHTVAKITPEDYTAGVAAVNAASGVDISGYANRFKITDQTIISPPSTVSWKLIRKSDNTLVLKPNVPIKVDGTDPNAWKTLKEAIEAESVENGDEFIIRGTIKATSASGNSGEITVTKNITVRGDGTNPKLDANSNGTDRPATPHRIFTVENGAELTLEDIQLENGNAGTENGGAILIKEGGSANIKNTHIYGCKANSGGAIYNKGTLILSVCHIGSNTDANEATDDGGAICSVALDPASCTIKGTDITYNKAGRSGGGICIVKGNCTIEPKGTTPTLIDHNVCSGSSTMGGGIYVGAAGSCTISGDTKISNNSCANGSGGGVYVYGTFVMEGGARVVPPSVAVAGNNDVYLSQDKKYITLKSALSGAAPVARITPSQYIAGRAVVKGDGYTLTASDTNQFTVTPEIVDGVTHKWELIPDSENFYKLKMGDAIIPGTGSDRWKKLKTEAEKTNGPDVIIIDREIVATSSPGDYGEITIGRNLTIKGKTDATTDKLDADNRSRIFKVENGKTLTLEKLTLKNGQPTVWEGHGGGMLINSGSTVQLTDCCIEDCVAKNGGGIYVAVGASCTLDGVTMKDNTVNNGKGSAVYVSRTADETPTLTLKGDVQIGDSAPNSNTICLGYAESSSTILTAFVSATSGDLDDTSHINIEPEDYIKQSNLDLVKGTGIGWDDNLFNLTNMPTSKGSWMLNKTLGTPDPNRLALVRTEAVLSAPPSGSWKALKEAIQSVSSGGTLKLSGTFNATSGDDSGEILLRTKTLTIEGDPSAGQNPVIDAGNKCRIFNLQGILTLKDITLSNGDAGTDSGGAVYMSNVIGELYIKGSTRIVPSGLAATGKNDVYLKDGKTINIVGALTGAKPVAWITPEKYEPDTKVLDGDIIIGTSQNYKKFKVTPVSLPKLYVGSDGRLTYTPQP